MQDHFKTGQSTDGIKKKRLVHDSKSPPRSPSQLHQVCNPSSPWLINPGPKQDRNSSSEQGENKPACRLFTTKAFLAQPQQCPSGCSGSPHKTLQLPVCSTQTQPDRRPKTWQRTRFWPVNHSQVLQRLIQGVRFKQRTNQISMHESDLNRICRKGNQPHSPD